MSVCGWKSVKDHHIIQQIFGTDRIEFCSIQGFGGIVVDLMGCHTQTVVIGGRFIHINRRLKITVVFQRARMEIITSVSLRLNLQ